MFVLLFFIGLPEFEASAGNEVLIEELQQLARNPIQVNIAKEEDFTKLYWISPQLANSIVKTRKIAGKFKEVDDLLKCPGMSGEILDKIRPYITVATIQEKPLQLEFRARVQERFPTELNNKLGDPRKAYERFKFEYNRISGVMLIEKDAYEADYMDFVSCGLMVQLNDRVPKLLLGDYKLEFGEGLVFGFSPIVTFKKQGMIKGRENGIQLYTNSGENTFLRGVCGKLKITNHIKNFIFFSNVKLDGKVKDGEVSIYYDYEGDHSTESKLATKDRVREILSGTRFEYNRGVKFGFTGYRNLHFLNPEGTKVGEHTFLGADFSYFYTPILWFGEVGRCDEIVAGIVGAEYNEKKLKLGSLYRYYPTEFYVFHSSPWSSGSKLSEKGSYIYMGYKISNNTRVSCYFDNFTRLPKLGDTELPVYENEYSTEMEYKFTNYMNLIGRYSVGSVGGVNSERIRVQSDVRLKYIKLRGRVEKVYETHIKGSYSGGLMYGDIDFRVSKNLTLATRLIWFNSSLHKFRLSEYEQDLPGVMRNQFISGKGHRSYIFLDNWLTPYCRISVKYEITSKTHLTQKYGVQVDLRF